ncbi:Urocanate hydratase [Nitrospina gracilis 3/211]|uniref:Urocanate hydratase n=1 Tax=Nitrospina gracilis (strain 3/211) TaxID=1266370 RepID=M1ZC29_NITG3|nr:MULTISPECIES: urocanate hydratase [Nitrospina]MCF8723724.1 urocanate hydratase [Nitrospina sp. Nb-3]CCQ90822.1 Urocanate hydratase [Nitrospina gracilis 3/211]
MNRQRGSPIKPAGSNKPSSERPLYSELAPKKAPRAPTSLTLRCCDWDAEAALRMLMNNLDDRVALDWKQLIVYGGTGRAARNWKEYHRLVAELKRLKKDETLCVQSGKPVYIARTHPDAPRVLIANSNLVPRWATDDHFDHLDRLGLMMYGQMTAGSWIYIGTQGILQGTYETFGACGQIDFNQPSLRGKWIFTAGLGNMGAAQPLAGTMNDASVLVAEVNPTQVERRLKEGYLDRTAKNLKEALDLIERSIKEGEPISVGLVANGATVARQLAEDNRLPDIVTDQTSAHNLMTYVPEGGDYASLMKLRDGDPDTYRKLSMETAVKHCQAMIDLQAKGCVVFDYGNNLRGQAELGGLTVRDADGAFLYPGFVPAYIRPLFCEGQGPFRWALLSGKKKDLHTVDQAVLDTFPEKKALRRWITQAQKQVPVLGLPTRVCWLGYGERAKMGAVMNQLVKKKKVAAPIVIGRDHLDCGSVASPNRETEGMLDGSDAVADWPLLNFAVNAVSGASWVSFHHGGGVGMGNSLHAGMVIVADGTKKKGDRLDRVLTHDPGLGVARHVDAGYDEAKRIAQRRKVHLPKP